MTQETNERELRFEERMRDADALAWSIEKDPMLRSTIIAVLILDQTPVRGLVAERLERGSRLVPRLRQRVVSSPWSLAPPRWEVDPYFDLDYHLRWARAAGSEDVDQVLRMAEPIAMQGFDRDRSLWEMTIIEGLTVPVPLYFAGAKLLAQFPFGPLSGAAANLCLLSYVDQLHIGANTDPAAVVDPDVLHACLRAGFEDIAALA